MEKLIALIFLVVHGINVLVHHAFRKQNAGMVKLMMVLRDINAQPFPSWSLDSNDDWQPPVARPAESTLTLEENVQYIKIC